jgi:hypothetical protein
VTQKIIKKKKLYYCTATAHAKNHASINWISLSSDLSDISFYLLKQ